jgi:carboxynorspermidine decarboxylase
MKNIQTPYYFIDEKRLLRNLEIIAKVKKLSGAKFVLALKCFSTWGVFPLISKYLDGTTSSSLYEARLGYEKFGRETHAYSVGYTRDEVLQLKKFADKIIFNSVGQLNAFYKDVKNMNIGVRVNPGISYSHFDLADPARKFSRLGVTDKKELLGVLDKIKGVMFHYNCENADFENLSKNLDFISKKYAQILDKCDWVSFGGGMFFTKENYPVEKFALKLKEFALRHAVQVYLEPGEAAITGSADLVTTVLDIVKNKKDIAILDASAEAHMLDLIIYRESAKIALPAGKNEYIFAGRSCLAGDVFGTQKIKPKLKVGDKVVIANAAGYTMVKKNWFNGLQMPAIVIKRLNGKIEKVQQFTYNDYVKSLGSKGETKKK